MRTSHDNTSVGGVAPAGGATLTVAASPSIVRVDHLVKRYGATAAVADLSFSVRPGEIFGLLGPNGAGKTTTIEIIEGIRTPDSGTVEVFGLNIQRQRRAIQARVGVQLQSTTLFPELTVRETLALFGSFYPHARPVTDLLRAVALEEKAHAFPQDLSGGQRQRLALALALVNEPELVILDEPTTGLDPQSRHALWDIIQQLRQQGVAIILTTHFMDEAQVLCDRIAIVDHGQIIAEDTPAGLIALLGASAAIAFQFVVPTGTTAPDLTMVRQLPGVEDARAGLDQLILYTRQTETTLIALLHLAEHAGVTLEHLQLHTPTLEDVFLKLTGRQLRS